MKVKTATKHVRTATAETDRAYKAYLIAGDSWSRAERKRSDAIDNLIQARRDEAEKAGEVE